MLYEPRYDTPKSSYFTYSDNSQINPQQYAPNNNLNDTRTNQLTKFNARTLEMNRNTLARFSHNPFHNLQPTTPLSTLRSNKRRDTSYNQQTPKVVSQQQQHIHPDEYNDNNNVVEAINEEVIKRRKHKPRNPIQRAASRLYKAGDMPSTVTSHRNSSDQGCIGPEFVVRSSLPSKQLEVGHCKVSELWFSFKSKMCRSHFNNSGA